MPRPPARGAATAMLLAAGLALTACGQADETGPTPTAAAPASSAPSTTSTPQAPDETVGPQAAQDAVRTWLTAAREGDVAAMQAGLGRYSRQQAEALGGLEGMASGLAEGMSAFLDAGHWTTSPVPGADGAYLVVASGEVTREGMTETAARSWLVHPEGGDLVVETFAAPVPQVISPLPGEPHRADAPVVVELAAGDVLALVDGEDAGGQVTSEPLDGEGLRVSVTAPDGWSADGHVVAVAVTPSGGADGVWASVATAFSVD